MKHKHPLGYKTEQLFFAVNDAFTGDEEYVRMRMEEITELAEEIARDAHELSLPKSTIKIS